MIEAKILGGSCELNASGDLETLAEDLAGIARGIVDAIDGQNEEQGMYFRTMFLKKLLTAETTPLSGTVTSFPIKGGERYES